MSRTVYSKLQDLWEGLLNSQLLLIVTREAQGNSGRGITPKRGQAM